MRPSAGREGHTARVKGLIHPPHGRVSRPGHRWSHCGGPGRQGPRGPPRAAGSLIWMAGGLLSPPSGLGCDDTRDSHSPVQGSSFPSVEGPPPWRKVITLCNSCLLRYKTRLHPWTPTQTEIWELGGRQVRGVAWPGLRPLGLITIGLHWGGDRVGGASRMTEPPQMLLKGIYCKNMVFVFLREN